MQKFNLCSEMGISKGAWIKLDPSDAEDFGNLLKIYI